MKTKATLFFVLLAIFLIAIASYYFLGTNVPRYQIYRDITIAHHKRLDRQLPQGIQLLFGSSTINGIPTSRLVCPSANFGIGGETIDQLRNRLPEYGSVTRASSVIIQSGLAGIVRGHNADLRQNFLDILNSFGPDTGIVLIGLQPVISNNIDEQANLNNSIRVFNKYAKNTCAQYRNCSWIELWPSIEEGAAFLEPDGIHLNTDGYNFVIAQINSMASRYCQNDQHQ